MTSTEAPGQRLWIRCADADERERLLAEAFEAGASGAEERDDDGDGLRACIYASAPEIEAVVAALRGAASATTEIGEPETLPQVDWSRAWRERHVAVEISPRLVVRPPFAAAARGPGRHEIVIDPGQAFGTGSHASTRLCLEWIDSIVPEAVAAGRSLRVLDVGTGSGVLALAAVALGAGAAVGVDLDPLAVDAARVAARDNGLEARVAFELGGVEGPLGSGERFGLVLANLLRRELWPIAEGLAGCLAEGGQLVLAGLLAEDRAAVLDRFAALGLRERAPAREIRDDVGCWIGLCLSHGSGPGSAPDGAPGDGARG